MVAEIKNPPPPNRSNAESPRSQTRRPPERRGAIWGPLLVVLVLAIMLVAGIWRHVQQNRAQRQFAEQTGKTTVEVLDAKRDAKPHDLMLPGNITAIQETTIFAR